MLHSVPKGAAAAQARATLAAGVWAGSRGVEQGERALGGVWGGLWSWWAGAKPWASPGQLRALHRQASPWQYRAGCLGVNSTK